MCESHKTIHRPPPPGASLQLGFSPPYLSSKKTRVWAQAADYVKGRGYLPLPKVENPSAWGSTGPQEQPPRLHAAGKDRTKGWHLQCGDGVQPDGGRGPFPSPCPALPHPAESQFSISHHVLSC